MTEQPPKGYGTVEPREKYSLPEFELSLNANDLVGLYMIDDYSRPMRIYTIGDDINSIILDKGLDSCDKSLNTFKPTNDFWDILVEFDKMTSSLLHDRSGHLENFKPEPINYPVPTAPTLPKYEEIMCRDIYHNLLHAKSSQNHYFSKKRQMGKLFRRAYAESEGSIPPRLRNLDRTPEDYKWL